MEQYPKKLAEIVEVVASCEDREMRSQLLIEFADMFEEVPESIAKRPFSKANLVPACESEAYIWSTLNDDGTMKFYFAVENPQGISAMALASIIDQACSGTALEELAKVDTGIVYDIFGRGLSMGKGQGLMSMVGMVREGIRKYLETGVNPLESNAS